MKRRRFIKSVIGGLIGLLSGKLAKGDTIEPCNDLITRRFVSEKEVRELDESLFDELIRKKGIKEPDEVTIVGAVKGNKTKIEIDYISRNIK